MTYRLGGAGWPGPTGDILKGLGAQFKEEKIIRSFRFPGTMRLLTLNGPAQDAFPFLFAMQLTV